MAQLNKLADKGDAPLSPADFRRIVRYAQAIDPRVRAAHPSEVGSRASQEYKVTSEHLLLDMLSSPVCWYGGHLWCQGHLMGCFMTRSTDKCRPNLRFMIKLLCRQLVVPDFVTFCDDLSALAQLAAPDTSGNNADYIPPLRCALWSTNVAAYWRAHNCEAPLRSCSDDHVRSCHPAQQQLRVPS